MPTSAINTAPRANRYSGGNFMAGATTQKRPVLEGMSGNIRSGRATFNHGGDMGGKGNYM